MSKVAERRRPRARPRRRPRRRLPGGPALPRGAPRPLPRATREQPGLVSAPDGRDALPVRDPALDHARHGARGRPPGGPRGARVDRRRAACRSRATRGLRRRRRGVPRARSPPIPANQAATKEELVARCNEDIVRAGEVAPRVFGRLPQASCEVRPVEAFKEKDAPFAYYFPPTPDGSRPGIYYVNTYDLPSRTLLQARVDDLPRGDPGPPLPDRARDGAPDAQRVPAARRPARPARAYVEGWGLYAERLADELGLYRDQAERLGMLDAQAWRASRLIVDSGMHAPGLVAPAVDRLAARDRPVRHRRHRSRPTATSRGRARRSAT